MKNKVVIGENGFTLIENGKSFYTVWCNDDSEVVQQAVYELRYYLERTTNVDIQQTEMVGEFQIRLVVDVSLDKLGEDGFLLQTKDKNIFITAKTGRGILYGVYDFLERFIGVKFLTYDYTHIERRKSIVLPEFDVVQRPYFDVRCVLSNKISNTPEFAAHMRMNNEWLRMPKKYGGKMGMHPSGHNLFKFLPPEIYAETHPQWYYVKDGKPKCLCFSHMGIKSDGSLDETLQEHPIKIISESFYNMLVDPKNDEYIYFNISQQDTFSILDKCTCDDCLTGNEYFGYSGMLIRFLNALSDRVKDMLKENGVEREFYIVTLAYMWSENPPWDFANDKPLHPTVVPRDNIFIRLAPINAKNYFSRTETRQISSVRNMFTFWQRLTKNIMVWDYVIDFSGYLIYYPTMHHWREDMCLMHGINANYVMLQAAHNEPKVWQDDVRTYVASKMLWDSELDYKALEREFIKYYYRSAAKYVMQFIDNLDKKYAEIFNESVGVIECVSTRIGGSLISPTLYSTEFWEEQIDTLYQALVELKNSDMEEGDKQRVALAIKSMMLTPKYMLVMKYEDYYPNNTPSDREKTIKEFIDLCEEVGIVRYREGTTILQLKELLLKTNS